MHYDTSTTEANMAEINDTADSPEEAYLKKTAFYVLIENVVTGLTVRSNTAKKLSENVDFFRYPTMCESELRRKQNG